MANWKYHHVCSVKKAFRKRSLWSREVTGSGSGRSGAVKRGPDAAQSRGSRGAWSFGWPCSSHLPFCMPSSQPHPRPSHPSASPRPCCRRLRVWVSYIQHELPCLPPIRKSVLWSCFAPCLSDCSSDAVSYVWPISKQHHRMKFKQCRCSETGLCWLDHEGKAEVRSVSPEGLSWACLIWHLSSSTALLWLVCCPCAFALLLSPPAMRQKFHFDVPPLLLYPFIYSLPFLLDPCWVSLWMFLDCL